MDHLIFLCHEARKNYGGLSKIYFYENTGSLKEKKGSKLINIYNEALHLYILTCRFKTVSNLIFIDLNYREKSSFLIEKYLFLRNRKFDEYENHLQYIIDSI